jgi:hypothetical protein
MTITNEPGRAPWAPAHAPGASTALDQHSWRVWVTRHPAASSAVAGLIATWAATAASYSFAGVGLPKITWPIADGSVVLPNASSSNEFTAGLFIHMANGLVAAVLFAVLVFPLLGRARSVMANLGRGLLLGLAVGTISAGFMVPYVDNPHTSPGAGLFSTGFGWKLTFAIYLSNLIFGVVFGLLYSPLDRQQLASA